jgi:hypothetical protein
MQRVCQSRAFVSENDRMMSNARPDVVQTSFAKRARRKQIIQSHSTRTRLDAQRERSLHFVVTTGR